MFEKIISVLRMISPVIIGSGIGIALYFFRSTITHKENDHIALKRMRIAFMLFAFIFAYTGLVVFSSLAKGFCFTCSAIALFVYFLSF